MGTSWSVALWGEALGLGALHRVIERALDLMVLQMSHWRADSVLGRYNRAEAGTWHALPPDFAHVLAAALALAAESDGAYDPTLGPLVRLWGFGPEGSGRGDSPAAFEPPSPAALALARAQVGWQRLRFEPARPGCAAQLLQPGGAELDLSSIAKGHAVDLVLARLRGHGVRHALVDVGGELAGLGHRPDGTPWRVAVKQPDAEALSAAVLALDGWAIATSGDDFQRHAAGGTGAISHTIDPRTGRPVPGRLASVTVAHPSCLQADALATALTVLGAEAGPPWARRRGLAALFIARGPQGFESHATPAFVARVEGAPAAAAEGTAWTR
jgi:thiamine biosynthesis lipoprotein